MKLAQELQKRVSQLRPERPLEVMAQVNTSAEESKGGCAPDECAALCTGIRDSCPALRLVGLMCIGKYSSAEGGSDEDFACLVRCRTEAAVALQLDASALALSMGMSHDYREALAAGATHVRVGSTIFGARPKKAAAAAPAPPPEPPSVEKLALSDNAPTEAPPHRCPCGECTCGPQCMCSPGAPGCDPCGAFQKEMKAKREAAAAAEVVPST